MQPVHSGTPKPRAAALRKETKRRDLLEKKKKKKRKLRIERPIARSYVPGVAGTNHGGGRHPSWPAAARAISRSQGTPARVQLSDAALRALQSSRADRTVDELMERKPPPMAADRRRGMLMGG